MDATNYSREMIVPNSPQAVYDAVTQVTAWWTVNTDGNTNAKGDEFTVQFGDVHLTKQRITEAALAERIVWLVTEAHLPWLKDLQEWKGTEIVFDIMPTAEGTRLIFTHIGLTPVVECYAQCVKGWAFFIGTSLFKLITTDAGQPDTTERTHMDIIGHVSPKNA